MDKNFSVTLEYAPEGDYIGLKLNGLQGCQNKGIRGEITSFSGRSRSRLLKKVSKVSHGHIPLFVTLTYHNNYSMNYEDYKYDFHRFVTDLRYRYPDFGMIWKLEYQKRGAPHFHLLLWGVNYQDAKEYIPGEWHKIAGNGSKKHLAWHKGELGNKHCVDKIRSWNGVRSYASKEMGKTQGEATDKSGRFWGVRGKVPFSEIMLFKMDVKAALQFRRGHRRVTGYFSKRLGYWTFGYSKKLIDYAILLQSYENKEYIPENFPPGWYRGCLAQIKGYELLESEGFENVLE